MTLNTYNDDDNLLSSKVNADFEGVSSGVEMHYNAEWTTFTPTWTSTGTTPAIGNGTLAGRYLVVGKTVFVRVFLLWGSTTSSGTGLWLFATPFVTNTSLATTHVVYGSGQVHDITGNLYYCWVRQHSTYKNKVQLVLGRSDTTYIQQDSQVGGTTPVTFATGDVITFEYIFEKA